MLHQHKWYRRRSAPGAGDSPGNLRKVRNYGVSPDRIVYSAMLHAISRVAAPFGCKFAELGRSVLEVLMRRVQQGDESCRPICPQRVSRLEAVYRHKWYGRRSAPGTGHSPGNLPEVRVII